MRFLRVAVILATVAVAAGRAKTSVTADAQVAFRRDVQPILERKCQPCHFVGGKMYQRLTFDRPETVQKLGTKLFTRIHDEREREAIRRFLAAHGG